MILVVGTDNHHLVEHFECVATNRALKILEILINIQQLLQAIAASQWVNNNSVKNIGHLILEVFGFVRLTTRILVISTQTKL